MILDWNQPAASPPAAATAAGLLLSAGVQIQQLLTDMPHSPAVATEAGPHQARARAATAVGGRVEAAQRLVHTARVEGQLRTAA